MRARERVDVRRRQQSETSAHASSIANSSLCSFRKKSIRGRPMDARKPLHGGFAFAYVQSGFANGARRLRARTFTAFPGLITSRVERDRTFHLDTHVFARSPMPRLSTIATSTSLSSSSSSSSTPRRGKSPGDDGVSVSLLPVTASPCRFYRLERLRSRIRGEKMANSRR